MTLHSINLLLMNYSARAVPPRFPTRGGGREEHLQGGLSEERCIEYT